MDVRRTLRTLSNIRGGNRETGGFRFDRQGLGDVCVRQWIWGLYDKQSARTKYPTRLAFTHQENLSICSDTADKSLLFTSDTLPTNLLLTVLRSCRFINFSFVSWRKTIQFNAFHHSRGLEELDPLDMCESSNLIGQVGDHWSSEGQQQTGV